MQFLKNTAASFFLCLALVACGGGGGGGSPNLGSTAFPSTTVSGKVTFDMVPVAVSGAQPRLNYAATARQPARSIVVEAIDGNSQEVLATASTNATGDYTLVAPNNRSVFIRALAKMNSIGTSAAPFTVVDNTDGGAQWTTDGAVFGSGTVPTLTQNLNAGSGWTGTAYDNAQRAAGPFAILDTVYQAAQKVIGSDVAVAFPQLELNWSPNNITSNGNRALGQIGTSFFAFSTTNGVPTRQIYVLGFANNDTDEYDRHVVAHEFGHYLQSAFSRDDSVGGLHGQSDRLDMRVAFSEGWGNAWSGIALANPVYADTNGRNQVGGLSFNVSQDDSTNPGWFKEASVQKVFWDFSNSPAIGFTQVWSALKNGLTQSAALAGIHSYARALADANPAASATISRILASQAIAPPTSSFYAENETNFGSPAMPNISPIYLIYGALGSTLGNICMDNAADPLRHGNKPGEFRYVRLSLAQSGARIISVTQPGSGSSNPDFVLYNRLGSFLQANGGVRNAETITTSVPAGDYVLALTDYNQYLPASGSPVNTTSCFSLTVQ